MTDRQILEEILQKVGTLEQGQAETNKRLDAVEENLTLKIELVNKRVADAEQNLSGKIDKTQEDTIEALKAAMSDTYDLQEARITALEEDYRKA